MHISLFKAVRERLRRGYGEVMNGVDALVKALCWLYGRVSGVCVSRGVGSKKDWTRDFRGGVWFAGFFSKKRINNYVHGRWLTKAQANTPTAQVLTFPNGSRVHYGGLSKIGRGAPYYGKNLLVPEYTCTRQMETPPQIPIEIQKELIELFQKNPGGDIKKYIGGNL